MVEDILVPLGICVALPVLIVWLVGRVRQNETNRKAEIILKSIEAGNDVDVNLFKRQKGVKTARERLLDRLTGACVTSLLGIAFILCGIFFPSVMQLQILDEYLFLLIFPGCILLSVGIALFIVYFVGKKAMSEDKGE